MRHVWVIISLSYIVGFLEIIYIIDLFYKLEAKGIRSPVNFHYLFDIAWSAMEKNRHQRYKAPSHIQYIFFSTNICRLKYKVILFDFLTTSFPQRLSHNVFHITTFLQRISQNVFSQRLSHNVFLTTYLSKPLYTTSFPERLSYNVFLTTFFS